jgi:hypothetical protein
MCFTVRCVAGPCMAWFLCGIRRRSHALWHAARACRLCARLQVSLGQHKAICPCGCCALPMRAQTRPSAHVSRAAAEPAASAAAPSKFPGDLLNRTYYPTSADASNVNKRWYIIDAKGQTLGRLASLAATYIRLEWV